MTFSLVSLVTDVMLYCAWSSFLEPGQALYKSNLLLLLLFHAGRAAECHGERAVLCGREEELHPPLLHADPGGLD